jgi:L-histidine N-alpha-methyltransferase
MLETIETEIIDTEFLSDVLSGLKESPKHISSKYFYDAAGDEIFQQIMALDEYYLTRAEHEIFETHKGKLLDLFAEQNEAFNLVEFGAGDGYKTKVLLNHFVNAKADFEYLPIDISQNALDGLKNTLKKEIPDLSVKTLQGDYFKVLDKLSHSSDKRNVLLFLGSNIGNFDDNEAQTFLSHIRTDLHKNDLLLIGVDLKKDPKQILAAYSDKSGVTAKFNLNLLERINRELDSDFDISKFQHHAAYDPVSGICSSALLSTEDQKVNIGEVTISFKKWEPIHTEISRKYDIDQIHTLAAKCGFEVAMDLTDSNGYFVDSVWRAV